MRAVNFKVFSPFAMTSGTIVRLNPQTGRGFVQRQLSGDRLPFSLRDVEGQPPAEGDRVEYVVVGGLAGCIAKRVRLSA